VARGELKRKSIVQNRKARRDYFIEETIEAGLVLKGTEVRSLRGGQASLGDCYARFEGQEAFLYNSHIPSYSDAGHYNHEPLRPRKLLLHKREIEQLRGKVQREGYTLVPLVLFFNDRGKVKVELGLARGKRQIDKRQREKTRDWERQKARLLRSKI
tara:strand:+ start:276 stop:746 length:471 start_codon:yes stop_codon:yes gene_type:complete